MFRYVALDLGDDVGGSGLSVRRELPKDAGSLKNRGIVREDLGSGMPGVKSAEEFSDGSNHGSLCEGRKGPMLGFESGNNVEFRHAAVHLKDLHTIGFIGAAEASSGCQVTHTLEDIG